MFAMRLAQLFAQPAPGDHRAVLMDGHRVMTPGTGDAKISVQGFAVESRPDLGVGCVSAELFSDLVLRRTPLDALQLAMAAVDAGQIADRRILEN